jgi:hypothetical protein
MKKIVSFVLIASFIAGCATPAGMVSKRAVSAGEVQTMKGLSCSDLQAKYEDFSHQESRVAAAMNKRAGAQLAANAIGIAALAFGGIGFLYTVRNEGDNRAALANLRGELDAMKLAAKDTNCDLGAVEQNIANSLEAEAKRTETTAPQ